MNRLRRCILLLLCAPADLLGLLLAVVVTLSSGARWSCRSCAVLIIPRRDSWVARGWPYSTTFGHFVLMHPDHGARVLVHELVHVAQFEATCCAAWPVLLASWLLPWWSLPPFTWLLSYAGASLAAWLNGVAPYLDNTFERHARAESGA